jgi:hypothetical protein
MRPGRFVCFDETAGWPRDVSLGPAPMPQARPGCVVQRINALFTLVGGGYPWRPFPGEPSHLCLNA